MPTQSKGVGHLVISVVIKRQTLALSIHQTIIAANILLGLHDGQARPAVDALHKLSVHFEIETRCVCSCRLVSIVANTNIIDVVRDNMGEPFKIQFRGKNKRSIEGPELEIVASHNLIRLLRFGIFEKTAVTVSDFTIEWRLVINTA